MYPVEVQLASALHQLGIPDTPRYWIFDRKDYPIIRSDGIPSLRIIYTKLP